MKLYADPVATSCRLLLAVLEHQALPVDVELISLASGDHRKPEFLAINPTGKAPVLIDGDFILTESLAITRYLLAARDCELYPKDARRRARVDELVDWVSTALAPAFLMNLVYPRLFPILRYDDPVVDAAVAARAIQVTHAALKDLDQRLERSGAFILGDVMTLADFAAAATLMWAPVAELSFEAWPNVAAWRSRMRVVPAWQAREAVLDAQLSAAASAEMGAGQAMA